MRHPGSPREGSAAWNVSPKRYYKAKLIVCYRDFHIFIRLRTFSILPKYSFLKPVFLGVEKSNIPGHLGEHPVGGERCMNDRRPLIPKKYRFLLTLLLILISLPLILWGTNKKITDSSYCASCHMMKPEFYTWEASSHNQVQCIRCHVEPEVNKKYNYRFFMVKEWYASITGDYGLVIQATSKIPDATCIECHNMEKRTVTPSGDLIIPHSKHAQKGINCTSCHTGFAHGNIARKRVTFRTDYARWDASIGKNFMTDVKNIRPEMDVCMKCHAVRKAPLTCGSCHETLMLPKSHQAEKFRNGGHGQEAGKDIKYCDSCHSYMSTEKLEVTRGSGSKFQQFLSRSSGGSYTMTARDYAKANTYCVDCHTRRPATHDGNFQITHGYKAQNDKNRCLTCHDNRPGSTAGSGLSEIVSCGSCHPSPHNRFSLQSHPVLLEPKQKVTEYCFTCHSETKCGSCHWSGNKKNTPNQNEENTPNQ
ncbi:MAG: NapC/NirT family cytochrome c [Bacillota bacterium]